MATLQDEVKINGMQLRNRIAMPPLTTNYGSTEGMVTEEILEFYKELSKDVGLVIVEATAVRADPVFRDIFPLRAGRNAFIRRAGLFVVHSRQRKCRKLLPRLRPRKHFILLATRHGNSGENDDRRYE